MYIRYICFDVMDTFCVLIALIILHIYNANNRIILILPVYHWWWPW